jgi:kynureninase
MIAHHIPYVFNNTDVRLIVCTASQNGTIIQNKHNMKLMCANNGFVLAETPKEAQKIEDSNADIVSYGQVQERKGQLNELIDANLGDHPEQSAQLKDIIEDWANLKVESFENRRSWVRSPKQKKED